MLDDFNVCATYRYIFIKHLIVISHDALESMQGFSQPRSHARAGRANFGQPSSLTLIKRITAKMSIAVTIKATERVIPT